MEDLFRMYDNCCRIRTKIISIERFNKPWLTDDLMTRIKRKHDAFLQFMQGIIFVVIPHSCEIYRHIKWELLNRTI